MSDGTKIEWTHIRQPDGTVLKGATWNIVTGCSVVSEGCKHCYAMKLAGTRLKHTPSRAGLTIDTKAGPVWNGQVRFNAEWLRQPLQWKQPRGVFVCAHGDLFHDNVPREWVVDVFAIMAQAPRHTFQILTKRPWNAAAMLGSVDFWLLVEEKLDARARRALQFRDVDIIGDGYLPNVWIGTSVENQDTANDRIPGLLNVPAAVRFLSCEPLLGPIKLNAIPRPGVEGRMDGMPATLFMDPLTGFYATSPYSGQDDGPKVNWVIVGGESGAGARPMHPDWARSIRDQCRSAGVPFFFKQWGAYAAIGPVYPGEYGGNDEDADSYDLGREFPAEGVLYRDGHFYDGIEWQPHFRAGCYWMENVGKKAAGRMLDGVEYSQFPVTA